MLPVAPTTSTLVGRVIMTPLVIRPKLLALIEIARVVPLCRRFRLDIQRGDRRSRLRRGRRPYRRSGYAGGERSRTATRAELLSAHPTAPSDQNIREGHP